MARPSQFDRDQVIDAALAVARRDGLREVSARRIAKELGASTSVIYARFGSLADLHDATVERVIGGGTPVLIAQVQRDGLRAVVRALCVLGQREPWLVEEIHLRPRAHPAWHRSRVGLAMVLGSLERFAHLDADERLALVSRITPAAVGLAVAAATGELTDVERGYAEVVEPVIAHVLATRPRDDLLAGAPHDL